LEVVVLAEMPIIDTDTHVCEPADLWTSRLSSARWGDAIPHVAYDERRGEDIWLIGGRKVSGVAGYANAGWREYPPRHPRRIEDAHPNAFGAEARVARMNRYGVAAEAIYPNLLAFSTHNFRSIGDAELLLECVRAYNDFQTDFASEAPGRFIVQTVLPFWDLQASVAEIERCRENGHHGVLFMTKPHKFDLPRLGDRHWDPILRTAADCNSCVSFHIGFQQTTDEDWRRMFTKARDPSDYALETSLSMIGLAEGLGEVLMSDICHRYPTLQFALVESGFGWIPYFLETLDWQWVNSGAATAHPAREIPSFYFRRQVKTAFWFEQETVRRMADLYPDNVMVESDFPHPTCLEPGPTSSSGTVREVLTATLAGLPEELCRKVLYENAAQLYGVDARTS